MHLDLNRVYIPKSTYMISLMSICILQVGIQRGLTRITKYSEKSKNVGNFIFQSKF
jgi:hypothetical protein